MDIEKLAKATDDEGVIVHFRDRNGEPLFEEDKTTPVTARVLGIFSKASRKAERRQQNEMLRRRRTTLDAQTVDEMALEREAACIAEWTFTQGGKLLDVSPENWKLILGVQPQFQQQVRDAMESQADFFVKSKTPSGSD